MIENVFHKLSICCEASLLQYTQYFIKYEYLPPLGIFYEGLSDTRFRLDSPSSHLVLKKITFFQYTFVLLSIVQLKLLKLVVIDRSSISCLVLYQVLFGKKQQTKIETLAILLSIIKIFSFKIGTQIYRIFIQRGRSNTISNNSKKSHLNEKIFIIDSKMACVSIFALLFFAKQYLIQTGLEIELSSMTTSFKSFNNSNIS